MHFFMESVAFKVIIRVRADETIEVFEQTRTSQRDIHGNPIKMGISSNRGTPKSSIYMDFP